MTMLIDDFQQGSPDWLLWRKVGITATDAAIITGRSRYKTRWQLWAEKLGYREPDDLSSNPFVLQGNLLEDNARQAAERYLQSHLGVSEILLPICGRYGFWHVLRASFDGLRENGEPVELKCPADSTFLSVRQDREESEPFQHYWPQVQHQILTSGAKRGWLVFFRLDENGEEDIEVFEIPADPEYHAELLEAAKQFHDLLIKCKEPKKDPEQDFFIPGKQQSAMWVAKATRFKELELEARELDEQLKVLKEKQKRELNVMTQMMEGEGFFKADFAGVAVTRFNQTGRTDWKALAMEHLPNAGDLATAYTGDDAIRCRVSVKADSMPKQIVMPEVRELLEEAEALQVDAFF